ncbi:hypothetical protein V496_09058 [Pseudogymnoascus sp. VKM F-4515 (FW-2607)]|nr:hypothetical protein V496_09058 [Pseudogymnoascus sp. VKM F-4515 (FW-2607)]
MMNQQSASNHVGAYSTRSVIIGEESPSDKLSAYNIRSDAMKQKSVTDKLSVSNTGSPVIKQEPAFKMLSAYGTGPATISLAGTPNSLAAYSTGPVTIKQESTLNNLGAYSTGSPIVRQERSSNMLSAYSTGSATIKQESTFNDLSAFSTGSATIKQESTFNNLSAFNTGSATIKQENVFSKLSANSTPFSTMKQENPSGKLSAYSISSVTRQRYSDVLHVGQHSISRDDECLDPDCSSFCQGIKGKSVKTELDCSQDDFSLNMDTVMGAFGGPFARPSLPPIPEHATASTAGPSLRDLGLTNSNVAISNPDLLIHPNLRNRVERYFEDRKPTPAGWTWSVNDMATTRPFEAGQSSASVALTDSSTVASGSVTGFSQAGPSRPLTPHLGSLHMDSNQMELLQMDLLQMDFGQMNALQMDALHMNPLQINSLQMIPLQTEPLQMGPPPMDTSQLDALTFGPGERADAIGVIGKMREIQTEGVQPFGPSRFLNHPHGNPTGNPNGNYLGTMSAASNQMTSLPDHMNTCIWVEGAPADLTYFEMLRSIRHCGKVYSVHINPPREKHFTAAAKIAFCTRLGAERFFQQAHSAHGIVIRGRRICVRWNRNKYRENFNRAESRVLRISGPSNYVNYKVLGEYFGRLFYFNLIWVEEVKPGVMIWEFSSILAQAHSAKQAIEREPAMMHMVNIKYERDPCE